MYQEEFKQWLEANGAQTPQGRSTRAHAVKTIEAQLAALGSAHADLDAAYAADRFEGLRTRLKSMRENAQQGGKDFRILMPQSHDPINRLSSWRGWLAQYGRFLEQRGGETVPIDPFFAGMDAMRGIFLDRMVDFDGFDRDEGTYWEQERRDKEGVLAKFSAIIASDADDDEAGRKIYRALIPSKGPMLAWQTDDAFHRVHPEMGAAFYGAMGQLARDRGPLMAAVHRTADQFAALRGQGAQSLALGQQLAIILTVAAFARPTEAGPFKPTKARTLSDRLLAETLFAGADFSVGDAERWLALNRRMFAFMRDEWGWKPRDMLDVQGFAWVALEAEGTSDADRFRAYALKHHILPARAAGAAQVVIPVREVDEAVGGKGHWRNVCSALRSKAFLKMANVSPPRRIGADESPATQFVFSLSMMETAMPDNGANRPTNLILYGPPGTGKTYATAREAVRICEGLDEENFLLTADGRDDLMAAYDALSRKGRIGFVTFHQSFSYEEFVEGLRPTTGSDDDEGQGASAGFSLKPHDGIFKQIATLAADNNGRALVPLPVTIDRSRKIFKMSQGRSWTEEGDRIFQDAIDGGYVVLGYGGEVDWSDPRFDRFDAIKERWREVDRDATGNDPNIAQIYSLRANMEIGSLIVISDGNRKFRAVGEVTGDYQFLLGPLREYNHRRPVRWLWHNDESLPRESIYGKAFSQVSVYQLNSRHVDWEALEQIVAGGGAAVETSGVPEPYVLIIDEINRANISKVFGELITLLESDKRIGMRNALRVRLPYSGDSFGVPANLHIIGTMNTADRSIALLDTALRRRFAFRELMPDPSVLGVVDGVDLSRLLTTLNGRIEYLFDREHQVGHAYFIDCQSRADIDATMRYKIVPLLAEYFYEDWGKVAAVLGDAGGAGRFVVRHELTAPPGMEDEGEGARYRWTLRDPFAPDAYAGLM